MRYSVHGQQVGCDSRNSDQNSFHSRVLSLYYCRPGSPVQPLAEAKRLCFAGPGQLFLQALLLARTLQP